MSFGQVSAELPRYKCHKEVWALKIKDLIPQTAESLVGSDGPSPDGAMLYPEEPAYAPFHGHQEYVDKHEAQIGGYYVVYKDGYKSFSPADAFEDGYARI
jgi:hypothetical protein